MGRYYYDCGRRSVHGEKEGAEALKNQIKEVYNWDCEIPELLQINEIDFDENVSLN